MALGVAGALLGLALGAVIEVVWQPCLGVAPPIDPLTTPRSCVEVTSGGNTAWISMLMWPLALGLCGFAIARLLRRGGSSALVIAIALGLLVLLANPLSEYALLNAWAQSWDEPPGTGALTAASLVCGGIVLLGSEWRTRAR